MDYRHIQCHPEREPRPSAHKTFFFSPLVLQLQRLKRSLSFKVVMRSKSVDNFFQRSNGDSRPPSSVITEPPTQHPEPSPPPFSECPPAYECSPSGSPDLSLSSRSPSVNPSPVVASRAPPKSQATPPVQPLKTHSFQEHVFRRPTSCQRCKHMIQGESHCGSWTYNLWIERPFLNPLSWLTGCSLIRGTY